MDPDNLDGYPGFQRYFRDRQPPTLIVWGRNDEIFGPKGAKAYLRDLPNAELHPLDTGHLALAAESKLGAGPRRLHGGGTERE